MFVFDNFIKLSRTEVFFDQEFEHTAVFRGDVEVADGTVFQAYVQSVVPAAAVCAFALVGAAVGKEVGNQAAAGIRHAHCPVDKGFKHDIGALPADFRHLGKRYFAAEHAQVGAERLPEFDRLVGTDVGLGGNETFQLRRVFF